MDPEEIPLDVAPTRHTRSRGWCFTINNYTELDVAQVKALEEPSSAIIAGYEVAPTTGTPHIQGYVYFLNQRSFIHIAVTG